MTATQLEKRAPSLNQGLLRDRLQPYQPPALQADSDGMVIVR